VPELPEVQTIVNELQPLLKGRVLQEIKVLTPKMVIGESEKVYGQKILGLRRRAKLIIFDLSNGWHLLIHLKLTGQLFFLPPKAERTKTGEGENRFTAMIFYFDDGSRLLFNDLRKFGYLKILDEKGLLETLQKEDYGPEPLEPDFTLEKFQKMLAQRPNAQIKPLLMDQGFVAGIGNLYSDEILFFAGIHPKRKVNSLDDTEIEKIYQGIKTILQKALKYKGSSIDTYRRPSGEKGTFEFHRKVYRRKGGRCFVCGTPIASLKFGGRTAYYCPTCQK